MTGLEFYKINDPDEIRAELDAIIIGFLRSGYQNILSWEELRDQMKFLIRKFGWAQMEIEKISEQTGKSLGMKVREELSASHSATN